MARFNFYFIQHPFHSKLRLSAIKKQLLKHTSYHPVLLILYSSCLQLSQVTFCNLALTNFWSR